MSERMIHIDELEQESVLLDALDNVQDPQHAHYELLLKMAGIPIENALIVVPFLERDHVYNISAFPRKIRLNNNYSNEDEEAFEKLSNLIPYMETIRADVMKEIPLRRNSVDLVVINHGVLPTILERRCEERGESANYFAEVDRVMKPGGIVMGYDYGDDMSDESAHEYAKRMGMEMIVFDLPQRVIKRLQELTGKTASSFEEFFSHPEGEKVFFLRKVLIPIAIPFAARGRFDDSIAA